MIEKIERAQQKQRSFSVIDFLVPCCSALGHIPRTPSAREYKPQGHTTDWEQLCQDGPVEEPVTHTIWYPQGKENKDNKRPADHVVESGLCLGTGFGHAVWPEAHGPALTSSWDQIFPLRQVREKLLARRTQDNTRIDTANADG